jgi:hypothetical protein
MLQDIRIIISIAQCLGSYVLSLMIALWGQETLGVATPTEVQHILAKLHLTNK